ncbi:MAG: ketoglutarate semialdehyde dehydrogenase [Verrucomicrobiales bacterium]|jgi:NADP-dependent aldehyde dehydrogenase|nr:ketoglutarate semialdehyde dehydrogenase [Verrucomicrobiales bacterium]|tara:strand:- start:12850 stop:14412 length:1563 start_codon:yes stop_codon:yes gene_type:complete
MPTEPVLIAGKWRNADTTGVFYSENPSTCEQLPEEYPISSWVDCEAALDAASKAFKELRSIPAGRIADFLERYATLIEERSDALVELAHQETGLPKSPRLADVELPRTTGQLRLAAAAARTGNWRQPIIDSANNIRSCHGAIGPVVVFGPNNFPFAFGSISGGDFAAAIAAGNPVIAKANSSHPGTTKLFAEAAHTAGEETGMPSGMVQLIYRTSHPVGEQLVTDSRTGATGYTGAQNAGLKLKKAADDAGKPIYLELSSLNPVVLLPSVLEEKSNALAEEFTGSCLMGAGQFCTNPGMIIVIESAATNTFIEAVATQFQAATPGTLLSASVEKSLHKSHEILAKAGAELLCGSGRGNGTGYNVANTLLRISGSQFLRDPKTMQTEAFGNSSLIVVAESVDEAESVIAALEGNLTGCIYSSERGDDDEAYDQLAPILRQKTGRFLNDKMPTGVAVSPAMNHGGPYPATGHPSFTAVGIPGALLRFSMLQSYDNVRPNRLPEILMDEYHGPTQRLIDGVWK